MGMYPSTTNEDWKDEVRLEGWTTGRTVTVGVDTDGDIGFLDEKGYSIIIARSQLWKLKEWIEKQAGDADDAYNRMRG